MPPLTTLWIHWNCNCKLHQLEKSLVHTQLITLNPHAHKPSQPVGLDDCRLKNDVLQLVHFTPSTFSLHVHCPVVALQLSPADGSEPDSLHKQARPMHVNISDYSLSESQAKLPWQASGFSTLKLKCDGLHTLHLCPAALPLQSQYPVSLH